MKKIIPLILFLFLISCTKETTIYIQTANFNSLTELEIDQIRGVGDDKIGILMKEMENGKFKNKEDFQHRMKGKLSSKMILKISNGFIFTTSGGT